MGCKKRDSELRNERKRRQEKKWKAVGNHYHSCSNEGKLGYADRKIDSQKDRNKLIERIKRIKKEDMGREGDKKTGRNRLREEIKIGRQVDKKTEINKLRERRKKN